MGRGHYHVTGCSIPPWSPHRCGPCWRLCERFPAVVWATDMGDGRGFVGGEASAERRWEERVCRHKDDVAQRSCAKLSWGSAVLSYTYHHLCCASDRETTDIAGCAPLVMSLIYQRFPQWCLPQRNVVMFPLAARHDRRMIAARADLDRVGLGQFVCTPYDDLAWEPLRPAWMLTVEEQLTWRVVVPIGQETARGEQQVPADPVNLDGFLAASARGEDQWWPVKNAEWYEAWRGRFGEEQQDDLRLEDLPEDIPLTTSQPRDALRFPGDRSRWEPQRPVGAMDSEEEEEYARQEDMPGSSGHGGQAQPEQGEV
ncbi:hypothetical protein PIB30_044872 [Stylosanthes scabra]|uniref:Uncharacterized protein n=1 Tax=Stylosanthes scabra TaxID=79078 RepID=A0ABU6QGP5_9FABA|nr:hypothetical protein [Stylosanthes scabra]